MDENKELAPAHKLIAQAFELAVHAHATQTDKGERPYIGHILRVAGEAALTATPDHCEETIMTALLHDVVEDADVTLDDLRQLGFPEDVVTAVGLVSKPDDPNGMDTAQYLGAIKQNPLALTVKRADITDNTDPRRAELLDEATKERFRRKYSEYLKILGEQ